MQAASGHITLVQEERFLLECDDGRKQLFLLSHKLPYDPEDLRAFQREHRRVVVDYENANDLIAGLATALRPTEVR